MRYDLFRLIMLERSQTELWVRDMTRAADEGVPAREWWLRQIFSQRLAFTHHGTPFHFVPESGPLASVQDSGLPAIDPASKMIIGKIGRVLHLTENAPPEDDLAEIERDTWKAAAVIIDPTAHDNGQMLAMEVDGRVGQPISIMKSLAGRINASSPPEPLVIEINPIADAATFWAFEAENRDEITTIKFELTAPNMFGTRSELDAELKALRDHEKMRKAKLELENPDGLKLDTDRVRNTVSYALEGGGDGVIAKTKTGKSFNSKRKTKRIVIPPPTPEEIPARRESFAMKVERAIAGIFSRD